MASGSATAVVCTDCELLVLDGDGALWQIGFYASPSDRHVLQAPPSAVAAPPDDGAAAAGRETSPRSWMSWWSRSQVAADEALAAPALRWVALRDQRACRHWIGDAGAWADGRVQVQRVRWPSAGEDGATRRCQAIQAGAHSFACITDS